MNTSAIYPNPRDKSMASAKALKSRQQMTAEEYEYVHGKPAPAWMSASVEDIACHIDMVFDAARDYGVQLKWEQIEYGLTWEQICELAKAKQSYKYTIGDYLPREAKRLDRYSFPNSANYGFPWLGEACVRDYFGVYYITVNDCVVGFFRGEQREIDWTNYNLTQRDIFAIRFDSYDEAKQIFNKIIA